MRLYNQSTRTTIRTLTLLFALTSLLLTMISPFVGTAHADHVEPVFQQGNPNCETFEIDRELKVEPVTGGSHDDDTLFVDITIHEADENQTFDFTVTSGPDVLAVIVKGGSVANLYDYRDDGGSRGDTGLHAPVNEANGKYFGLSHISFCYDTNVDVVPTGTLTTDCGTWSANVSVPEPGEGLTATNTPILFEVRDESGVLDSVSLDAGESDTLSGSFGEDTGDHAITLVAIEDDGTGDETQLDTDTVETDCDPNPVDLTPTGTLTTECGTWSADVSVSDLGEHETGDNTPILFEVRDESGVLDSVSLDAGESDTLSGSFGEDTGDHAITLVAIEDDGTGDETQLDTDTVETDCEPNAVELSPAGTLTTDCGTWEANFSVAGLGEHEVASNTPFTFEVREGDTVLDSATGLFAGDSGTLSGTFGEDSGIRTITLVAIDADGEGETTDLDTADVDTDCEDPFVIVGDPLITATTEAVCETDAAYLTYEATTENVDSETITIHWFDADGVEQHTDVVEGLSGQVLWPGAEVDEDGFATDWPGFVFDGEVWEEGDDGFGWANGEVTVTFEVNPTTDPITVTYPADADAADGEDCLPPEVEVAGEQFEQPAPAAKELPRTGLDTAAMALWAALLAGLGAMILLATDAPTATVRRRR